MQQIVTGKYCKKSDENKNWPRWWAVGIISFPRAQLPGQQITDWNWKLARVPVRGVQNRFLVPIPMYRFPFPTLLIPISVRFYIKFPCLPTKIPAS